MSGSTSEHAVQGIVRACYSAGGDVGAVRGRLLDAIRRVVPFDAAFIAGADPDSLLFTSAFAEEPLAESGLLFLDNEFGAVADVNRFAELARSPDPVGSLDDATRGEWATSARWREIMGPLGMGDELRAALRVDGSTWGFLCLHRSGERGFSSSEMAVLRRVAPHVGEAIRRATIEPITRGGSADPQLSAGEAVILVADDLVLAVAGAVEQIGEPLTVGGRLPGLLAAVARRLEAIETGDDGLDTPPAATRMTTASGALLTVHAARLRDASGTGPIVLTIAPAAPAERSSLLLAGYGLTTAQCRVANLVLQGRTTSQIAIDLRISAHTVQDHLKVVFDKVGVHSRRELVGVMMQPPG